MWLLLLEYEVLTHVCYLSGFQGVGNYCVSLYIIPVAGYSTVFFIDYFKLKELLASNGVHFLLSLFQPASSGRRHRAEDM